MRSNELLVITGRDVSLLIAPSHQMAFGDPKHCNGYSCYTIGYNDRYNDAQNRNSPAYACMGHSEIWCAGYNDGFRAGNGANNIFYGQTSDQSVNIHIHDNNNKISINQQSNNQIGDTGFTSVHKSNVGTLPNCVILCLNSDIRIK
jgi:hypothetical protein